MGVHKESLLSLFYDLFVFEKRVRSVKLARSSWPAYQTQNELPFVGFQWSKVQSAKFSILEHQMDPSSNFSSYRSTLKAAMWRSAGATDERQRIVVPFFSLLVKDLYFLNEGCSNK
jgi:hypothetical protein